MLASNPKHYKDYKFRCAKYILSMIKIQRSFADLDPAQSYTLSLFIGHHAQRTRVGPSLKTDLFSPFHTHSNRASVFS